MTSYHEKGNALESAVHAIEELILRTSPNLKEKTYVIESKKLISVDGVRHEIDLFVTCDLGGPGYNAVYIFECKNWKDAVGKNEIVIFAEKIKVCGAQRGFFVAKSFTGDAIAQAKTERRMELVVAAEHDRATTILPFQYQSTFIKLTHIGAHFRKWGAAVPATMTVKCKLAEAVATLSGEPLNLSDYMNAWVAAARDESMRNFPSGTLPDGTYQREFTSERTFPEGCFIVNSHSIETATITLQFEVYLLRPAVKSHFEINGRGRVISFEAHTVGDATFNEVQFTFGPGPSL